MVSGQETARLPDEELDARQQSVVAHSTGPLLVLGAAGTGKTTTLVELVRARVADGIDPRRLLVLTPRAESAADLRDRLARRLTVTTRDPLARSFHSYAFDLLRRDAHTRGLAPPLLLTASEQDAMVRDLLHGDLRGEGVDWPPGLRGALATAGFGQELRDLVMRLREQGITPTEVRRLAHARAREDWRAVADFAEQYERVLGLRGEGRTFDQAEMVTAAEGLLAGDLVTLAEERSRLDLVIVAQYEEVNEAQRRLLLMLCGDGRPLVAFCDPDQAVFGFRGSHGEAVRDFAAQFRTVRRQSAPVVTLTPRDPRPEQLRRVVGTVSARLPGPAGHRYAAAGSPTSPDTSPEASPDTSPAAPSGRGGAPTVELVVADNETHEATRIADYLHRCHVHAGYAWSEMAVLVRGSEARTADLRRLLHAADVPVRLSDPSVPLARRPAVRLLLDLLEAAISPEALDDLRTRDLLVGPVGGMTPVQVAALQRWLTDHVAASDPAPQLSAVWSDSSLVGKMPRNLRSGAQRLRRVIDRTRKELAADIGAQHALWELWDASGLAPRWERASLSGGSSGRRADRDLDSVVELFDFARDFDGSHPGSTPTAFLAHIRANRLPVRAGQVGTAMVSQSVDVTTVHRAKGRHWQVVVVAGVQDGTWPDLRGRGGVLSGDDLLAGLRGAEGGSEPVTVADRLAAERRLFYLAVSRADRHLLVTAVGNETDGEHPSRFLEELLHKEGAVLPAPRQSADDHPEPPREGSGPSPPDRPAPSARSLVSQLRRVLADEARSDRERRRAASHLARLADAGVPGAHPDSWYGLLPLTDTAPLVEADAPVFVSPSRLGLFGECPLRWLLESSGGGRPPSSAQQVGRMVHALADQAAAAQTPVDEDVLAAALESAWPAVRSGEGWVDRRERDLALDTARKLARWLASRTGALLGTEVSFDVDVGRARLTGTVDRLERDAQGRAVIVDYKTGASVTSRSEAESHPQLTAYQLAAELGAFRDNGAAGAGGAALVHVRTSGTSATERHQPPLSEDTEAVESAKNLVVEVAAGMAAATFPAVANRHCSFCPVRSACPLQECGQQVTT